jgi:hypothetical protein
MVHHVTPIPRVLACYTLCVACFAASSSSTDATTCAAAAATAAAAAAAAPSLRSRHGRFFVVKGSDTVEMKPTHNWDDEYSISHIVPRHINRHCCAVGQAVVSHFSYFPNLEGLMKTHLYEHYRELAQWLLYPQEFHTPEGMVCIALHCIATQHACVRGCFGDGLRRTLLLVVVCADSGRPCAD